MDFLSMIGDRGTGARQVPFLEPPPAAGFAPDARRPSADPVRAGGRSSISRIGRVRPSLRRQRLAADAAGDAVVPLVVPPVAPVVPVVPSPVLVQADRASAAVSAHAREESRKRFMCAPEVLKLG
jgi:hypothetical protein